MGVQKEDVGLGVTDEEEVLEKYRAHTGNDHDDDGEEDLSDTAAMASSLDEESALDALLGNSPHSRMVGGTEFSWCRAVAGGTGITILGLLFSRTLDVSCLQQAIDNLQCRHPRLRSRLLWIHGKPALSVSMVPIVKVQVVDVPAAGICVSLTDDGDAQEDNISSVESACKLGASEGMNHVFSCGSTEDNTCCVESACELGASGGLDHAQEAVEEDDTSEQKQNGCSVKGGNEEWLRLVETELNTNEWQEMQHGLDAKPMFVVRLYNLSRSRCVLVLRLHTAVCDRASAATILTEMLNDFHRMMMQQGGVSELKEKVGDDDKNAGAQEECRLAAVEDGIPKGKANKPFWAHGVDLVGYSLGSRRHASLPFRNTQQPRRSEIACHALSVEHTQQLLQMCCAERTSRLGALCAAGLKATAIAKQLGSRNEHFAVITLIDCRSLLDPVLPNSTVGFYHSAILNTHQVNEAVEFWELARRCSGALESAKRNRKYFTDMGDVNFLMCQAIQFPHVTVAGALRTSLLVVFEEAVWDDTQEVQKAVGVEEYVGCSSIHGVGPSIAIFDTIQHGALKSTCVYPSPLHSRAQITAFLHSITDILLHALP